MSETLAALVAIVSSFFYALSAVFMRRGLVHSDIFSGFSGSLISSTIFMWALLPLYYHTITLDPIVLLHFAIGGMSGTALARVFMYTGMREVGAPVGAALSNLAPIMASAVGFTLLGESAGVPKVSGIALAVGGSVMLSLTGETAAWKRKAIALPIVGSVFFAAGQAIRKKGLLIYNAPLFGGAINITASMTSTLLVFYFLAGRKRPIFSRKTLIFSVCGIFEGIGVLFSMTALSLGSLSTVAPALNAFPLFVLLLGALVLKAVEKITLRIVVGVAMTVLGVMMVSAL